MWGKPFEEDSRKAPGSGLGLLELPEASPVPFLRASGAQGYDAPRPFLSLFTNVLEGEFSELRPVRF